MGISVIMQVISLSKSIFPQFYGQCKHVNNRNAIFQASPFIQSNTYFHKVCEDLRLKSFYPYYLKLKYLNSGRKLQLKWRNMLSNLAVRKIPVILKKHSANIVKTCSEQCEFVIAHRIRRGYQIFNMYSKLWGEVRLWLFLNRVKQQLARRGRSLIVGACVVQFNWERERISDDELFRHSREFERIYRLQSTISAPLCSHSELQCQSQGSQKKDHQKSSVSNETICNCSRCRNSSDDGWVEFYRGDSFIVWKKEEVDHIGEGLYCYKIYGCFHDVTAEDFFRVHCDTEFRKEWDKTALQLEIIDSDEKSNSDIIYWELLWPRMFSNRDYVFNRRFKIDNEKKLITIVNESTEHPNRPEVSGKHRVKEYWSYMVIKPRTEFHEPGVEFGITYFDNPGIRIPYAVSSWVTYSGLADYIKQQYEAAVLLSKRRRETSSQDGDNPSFNKFKHSPKESRIDMSQVFPADIPSKNLCI